MGWHLLKLIQIIDMNSLKLNVWSGGSLKQITINAGSTVCHTVSTLLFIAYTTNCAILKGYYILEHGLSVSVIVWLMFEKWHTFLNIIMHKNCIVIKSCVRCLMYIYLIFFFFFSSLQMNARPKPWSSPWLHISNLVPTHQSGPHSHLIQCHKICAVDMSLCAVI